MRYVKTLGLAPVAAMGLMAFLGAGSASATVLCSTTTTPCGVSWKWPVSTVIKASLDPSPNNSLVLKDTSGFVQDTCTTSSLDGSITEAGGTNLTVREKVENLAFGTCTKTTDPNNAAVCKLEIHSITGSSNGTVTGEGCTVTVVFTPPVTCTLGLGANTHIGTLTEGNPATLDFNANFVTVDGDSSLCPATGKWEAKYQITSPANTTLAVEPE